MNTISCKVVKVAPLTATVFQILLEPEFAISFAAGQYLNVIMAEDDKRPFSIASAPNEQYIELQIGAYAADSWAMQVIDRIKSNDSIEIEIPLGSAQLRSDSNRPIILLAGGTGFSYIKSILADLVNKNYQPQVLVYWGLRDASACYQLDETLALVAQLNNAKFVPIVETPDDQWQGRIGKVHEPLLEDVTDLAPYDIYMAGRFDMVGFLRHEFIENGAIKDHMYADAFAFI